MSISVNLPEAFSSSITDQPSSNPVLTFGIGTHQLDPMVSCRLASHIRSRLTERSRQGRDGGMGLEEIRVDFQSRSADHGNNKVDVIHSGGIDALICPSCSRPGVCISCMTGRDLDIDRRQ
jgi:hypothetical protein